MDLEEYEKLVPTHKDSFLIDGFFKMEVPDMTIFERPLEMRFYKPANSMHAHTMVYERENLITLKPYFELIIAVQTPYSRN